MMRPYLFALVDHPLHNALHPLECWAHLRARSDWRDSIVQCRFLVRIGKKAVFDRFNTFGFSVSLQLDVGCMSGVCGRCAVSTGGAKGHALSQISP